jgi:DNA-binding response OmpR family regulator
MRILVVEDERKVANFLKKGLEQSGYDVHLASDGEVAFAMFRATEYDLVLVDLMLPGMSGWELIPLLRKDKAALPILALTAKGSVEDRVRGLNLGCDDYLVKPFSFAELLARIQAQLRRGNSAGYGGNESSRPGDRSSEAEGHARRKGDRAFEQGVCPVGIPPAQQGSDRHPEYDPGKCLGREL